jgi:hypothetical protein
MSDVTFDEFTAAPPAHDQSEVVHTSSHYDEYTKEHRAETRTEALIVVSSTPPLGEAVLQEVIVPLPLRTFQDGSNDSQSLVGCCDFLQVRINLLLRGLLVDTHARLAALWLVFVLESIAGDELLAGLVRVEVAGLLAIGLVQVVLRRRGLEVEEIVEGNVVAVVSDDLIAELEDLMVCKTVWSV